MKEKEEIKRQTDKLKKQHQKDKQKERQKENEITKIIQGKKYQRWQFKHQETVAHVSDKDQQIKDLKIEPQKEKDTRKILLKDNVEMSAKINTKQIILKQKEQERRKGRTSPMRLKKKQIKPREKIYRKPKIETQNKRTKKQ